MRYLLVLLLSGCAYNVTLYPRGGGEQATGTYDGISAMTVRLKGSTYSGNAARGQSSGIAIVKTTVIPMSTVSNQYSAALVGSAGVLRCDFILNIEGGNGVCQAPDGVIYDLVVK